MKATAAAKKAVSHGGARNVGMRMANNKSGLAGVRYAARLTKSKTPVMRVYVCTAWTDKKGGNKPKRGAYSVKKYGAEAALDLAIADRLRAGLPRPAAAERSKALRTLKEYMAEVKHQDGKGSDDDED